MDIKVTHKKSMLIATNASSLCSWTRGPGWGTGERFNNENCPMHIYGLIKTLRRQVGFQIALQGEQGRAINPFEYKLHLCPQIIHQTEEAC